MTAMTSTHAVVLHALALLSLSLSVAGHGFVKTVTVDGQDYPGFDPNTDPYASPVPARVIRKIPSDGPVTATTSTDLTCNKGGQAGQSISANVKAGGTVVWQWNQWLSDHLGPVSTYMASCNGKCADADLSSTTLAWFKIDEKGFDPSGSGSLGTGNGRWGSEDVIAQGNTWTSTVPSSLASGEYLMRHEIVALHSMPAQPYPACLQVVVSGSGSTKPSSSDTVPIPGSAVYNDFTWPNIWNGNIGNFKTAGPSVASFAGGSASGGGAASSAGSGSASTKAASSTKAAASTKAASTAAATGTASAAAPSSTKCTVRRSETRTVRAKRRHLRSGH